MIIALPVIALVYTTLLKQGWEPGPPPPVAHVGMEPLPDEYVVKPMIFPVLGKCHWSNDYGVLREGFLHTAIDMPAPKMSPIVAPFDGTLGFWPNTFWIYGDDGWAMLGTHLNNDNLGTHDEGGSRDVMFAPDLVPGQHVYAGQFIGYVGMSGNATGPHLHFELFAPGEGKFDERLRNPFPSLNAAQVIKVPRLRLKGPMAGPGEMRLDGCMRFVDQTRHVVNIVLVSKQLGGKPASVVFGPRSVRLKVTDEIALKAGGWDSLQKLPATTPITCNVAMTPNLDDSPVLRLSVPLSPPALPKPVRVVRAPIRSQPPAKKYVTTPSVLIALAHDQGDMEERSFPTDIHQMGFASTVALEATSKFDLTPYDVVIVCHPGYGNFPYDAEEMARLKDYVEKDGGGVLLLGCADDYRKRLVNTGSFALDKLASQFGVTFANQHLVSDRIAVSETTPWWARELVNACPPSSDSLVLTNGNTAFVVNRGSGPVLAAYEFGSGRVLALSASPDKLLSQLERMPVGQNILREALRWLGGKRIEHPTGGTTDRILPQIEVTRGPFVFHCSSLFTEQEARGWIDAFQKIYEAEKAELGIDLPDSLAKVDVILVQTTGANLRGTTMYKGTSEDLDRFMTVTARELAEQWDAPGALPGGFHAAWADFCSYLAGMRLAKDSGNKRIEKDRTDSRELDWLAKADPDMSRIDVQRTDHDGEIKAFNMLIALHTKCGPGLWAKFLALFRPYAIDHPGPCPMAKFVELMSQAAGINLRAWFIRYGTGL